MNITKEEVQELLDAFQSIADNEENPMDTREAISLLQSKLEKDDGEPVTAQAAAIRTLTFLGYTYHGAEQWKPPLGKTPEPVAYLAWRDGKPCWDEDCVCQDAVYPVDSDDDRTSMPVYLHPAPKPMTDEEIDDALSDIWGSDTGEVLSAHLQRKIARAIEARCKSSKGDWVGLTHDEWQALYVHHHDTSGHTDTQWGYEFAIQAKLKEKNTRSYLDAGSYSGYSFPSHEESSGAMLVYRAHVTNGKETHD